MALYIERVERNMESRYNDFTAWHPTPNQRRRADRGLTFDDAVESRERQVYIDGVLCGKIFGTPGQYTGAVAFKDPQGHVVRDKSRTVSGDLGEVKLGLKAWIAACERGAVDGFNGWATPDWCYPDEN